MSIFGEYNTCGSLNRNKNKPYPDCQSMHVAQDTTPHIVPTTEQPYRVRMTPYSLLANLD